MSSEENELYPGDALKIGTVLNGYVIDKILGRGAFGITYLATEERLERLVAIKEYLPETAAVRDKNSTVHARSGPQGEMFQYGLDSFLNEAKTLVKFNHHNIVRVLTYFPAYGTAYLVMTYEIGMDLNKYLKLHPHPSEQRLLDIFTPINQGLNQVHASSYIHRDIKADNIYIREDQSPVLLDFGAARNIATNDVNQLTRILTVGYAPYEQDNPAWADQGPWTDIYALGATLYYCVTGQRPIHATERAAATLANRPDPLKLAVNCQQSQYSLDFLTAIDKALAFEPANRPQTLQQWNQMLLYGGDPDKTVLATGVNPLNTVEAENNTCYATDYEHEAVGLAGVKAEQTTSLTDSNSWSMPVKLVLATFALVVTGATYYLYSQGQPAPFEVATIEETQAEEIQQIVAETNTNSTIDPLHGSTTVAAVSAAEIPSDSPTEPRINTFVKQDDISEPIIEPSVVSQPEPQTTDQTDNQDDLTVAIAPVEITPDATVSQENSNWEIANDLYVSTMVLAKTACWHKARAEKIKFLISSIKALPATTDRTRFIVDQNKKLSQANRGFEANFSQYSASLEKMRKLPAEDINTAAENFFHQEQYADDANYRLISGKVKAQILGENDNHGSWRQELIDISTSAFFLL